jgi:methylated-DNA-protein-cysteine methyltransferase related protein
MFRKMLKVIAKVPQGRVATYGQIAKLAGYHGYARQVVWALQGPHNAPWHRIVGAGGKILLPGQAGLEQRMRLEMEGVRFSGSRVNMKEFAWQAKPAKSVRKKRK